MQVPQPVQRTQMIYTALMIVLLSAIQLNYVSGQNTTVPGDDVCEAEYVGPWSALLEEWATTAPKHSERNGRIMALPAANGYYVTERIDGPFGPPPPPSGPHMHPPGPHSSPTGHHTPPLGPHGPSHYPPGSHGPPPKGHMPQSYNEWEASPPTAGGKIVNRPPNPYKDKFKPSYPPPSPGQSPPRPQRPGTGGAPGAVDRVDEPPRKQVSETDLYLLGAIEKLVYRVDLMEKRLRKMEDSLHYIVAGTETKPEPCGGNFTRVGAECYWWSREAADWKGASLACRRAHAALLELHDHNQRRVLVAKLLADTDLQGSDFWTGGLNPGLLWIWSHSARPVATNSTSELVGGSGGGEGRCLALLHEPALRTYVYRGHDCSLQHRYICQKHEDKTKLSNDIQKAARSLKLHIGRRAKVFTDDV